MTPPIFAIIKASGTVTALIGSNPVRFYMAGEATQDTPVPYCVWQNIFGTPENFLGQLPDVDSWTTQIDVYADTATTVRAVAQAVRNALEPVAYVTSWNGESKDPATKRYRYSFDVAWITPR